MKHPNKGLLVMAAALASGLILTASAAEAKLSKKEVKKANHAIEQIHKADQDGDGLSNKLEKALGTKFKQATGKGVKHKQAKFILDDSDEDGLPDGVEVHLSGTDPMAADSDSDGINDGDEVSLGTEPLVEDTDEDGWTDYEELAYETDPIDEDTDGDGALDGTDEDPGQQSDEESFDIVGLVTSADSCLLTLTSTGEETIIDATGAEIDGNHTCDDLLDQEVGVFGAVVDGNLVAEEIYFTDVVSNDEDEEDLCAIDYESEDEWEDEWDSEWPGEVNVRDDEDEFWYRGHW
jgi:hypothetical protein